MIFAFQIGGVNKNMGEESKTGVIGLMSCASTDARNYLPKNWQILISKCREGYRNKLVFFLLSVFLESSIKTTHIPDVLGNWGC